MIRKKIEYGLILLAAAALMTAITLVWKAPNESLAFYKELVGSFSEHKYWTAAAIFVPFYVIGSLVMVPLVVLTLTSGVLFGVIHGGLIASFSALASAVLSFLIGRKFGTGWLRKMIDRRHLYQRLEHAAGREGWKMVLLLRLSPLLPFSVINFFLGASKISLPRFASATWVGMLPGMIVFAYLGSLARNITELSLAKRELSVFEWGLSGLGALAMLMLSIHLAFYAKKALRKQWAPEERTLPEDRPSGT